MKTNFLSRTVMILISLMISCVIYAQTEDENTERGKDQKKTPGDALISFTNSYSIGFVLQLAGVGVLVLSQTAMPDADERTVKTFSIVGGSVAFIGSTIEIISIGAIGRAGRLLNEQQKSDNKVSINLEPTQYGVGIVCRF